MSKSSNNGVPTELYFLIGLSLTLNTATQIIQPIFPLYVSAKGATIFELGLILSIMSFTALVAKIPMGILSNILGKWKTVLIALFGQSISLFLYTLAPAISWFYPIRIFQALIFAAYGPTTISMASDMALQGRRGDAIGRFLTSIGAATMFGPFVCSFLLNYWDYTRILQFSALIPLLGLFFFFYIRKAQFQTTSSSFRNRSGELKKTFNALKQLTSSRIVRLLSYLRLTFSFTNAFFTTLFSLYASQDLLLSSSAIALLFGVKGITNMIFRFPSGKIADKIGCTIPLVFSFLMLALTFFTLSCGRNIYILCLALAIYGMAHAMRAVSEWTLLGESTNIEENALATAFVSTMFNIGGAMGALIAGSLSPIISTPTIFSLGALIILPTPLTVALSLRKMGKTSI